MYRLIFSILYLISSTVFAGDINWEDTQNLIDRRFPDAPAITTGQLDQMLEQGEKPLIIDVRKKKEYAVSHLPGAVNVTSLKELKKLAKDTDTPVVFYCSVGYRSADMTEKAIKAGFVNSVNLQGSIFQWANEGRSVYSGDTPVHKVHPFDRKWGKLLDEQYRSE